MACFSELQVGTRLDQYAGSVPSPSLLCSLSYSLSSSTSIGSTSYPWDGYSSFAFAITFLSYPKSDMAPNGGDIRLDLSSSRRPHQQRNNIKLIHSYTTAHQTHTYSGTGLNKT